MARMGDKTIISPFAKFADFYPFYLSEHSDRSNRRLHFIGTSLGIAAILHSLSTLDFRWLLGGLVAGYGCAWVGHFFIERNRPATFTYPLYSFMGDWVMWKDILTGKIRF
jgi:hypothetical protein